MFVDCNSETGSEHSGSLAKGLSCTVRSESHCALRLRYIDLVVSIEVAVEVRCCCAMHA